MTPVISTLPPRAVEGLYSNSPAGKPAAGFGGARLRNPLPKSEVALNLFTLLQLEGPVDGNAEWLLTVIKYKSLCVAWIVCKPKSKECCAVEKEVEGLHPVPQPRPGLRSRWLRAATQSPCLLPACGTRPPADMRK